MQILNTLHCMHNEIFSTEIVVFPNLVMIGYVIFDVFVNIICQDYKVKKYVVAYITKLLIWRDLSFLIDLFSAKMMIKKKCSE